MIMMVEGAYGREADYNDWLDGRDFSMLGGLGPYFSIRDVKAIKAAGNTEIQFLDSQGWVKFSEVL